MSLIVSLTIVAAVMLLLRLLFPSQFLQYVGNPVLSKPRTWPLLVLSSPIWLCLPYALVVEWLSRRRHVAWWVGPAMLVLAASLLWSSLIGEQGEYEGFMSLIRGIPIGMVVSLLFLTYWIPLLMLKRRLRRHRSPARG